MYPHTMNKWQERAVEVISRYPPLVTHMARYSKGLSHGWRCGHCEGYAIALYYIMIYSYNCKLSHS